MSTFTITQTPVSKNLYLYPDGNIHSGCTAFGDTSNYLCVDDEYDIPDNDTYVWMSGVSRVTDWYSLQDHTTETGTINYVRFFARVNSDYPVSPSAYYYMMYKSGTTVKSSLCNVLTDYTTFNVLSTTTPGGNAWTWSEIDALQLGFEASSPTVYGGTYDLVLRPIANLRTAFSPTPSSMNNWECVDDTTPDYSSTYLWFAAGGDPRLGWDLYDIEKHTDEFGTINSVSIYTVMKETLAGPYFYFVLAPTGLSTTTYNSTPAVYPTKDWATYSYTWTTNPSNSLAWRWTADIDNLAIGIQSYAISASLNYFTQIYCVVNYTENRIPPINTTSLYAVVNYTPSSGSCYLNKPNSYTYTNNRDVRKINFWNGDRKVYDLSRSSKTLMMTGVEYNRGSAPTVYLNCVKQMKDNGESVLLSGFNDSKIDTYWMITDFNYTKNIENPNIYDWSLTLERYENV